MSLKAVFVSGYIAALQGKPASSNPHTPNGFDIVKFTYDETVSLRPGTDFRALEWAYGWKKGSGPWCFTCGTKREDVYGIGRCYECFNALYAWRPQMEEEYIDFQIWVSCFVGGEKAKDLGCFVAGQGETKQDVLERARQACVFDQKREIEAYTEDDLGEPREPWVQRELERTNLWSWMEYKPGVYDLGEDELSYIAVLGTTYPNSIP